MEYPGRLIIVGRDPAGEHDVVIYAVTGRSPSSQARRLMLDDDGSIHTMVTDPEILPSGNEKLLLYTCLRSFPGGLAVSNGAQTDLIVRTAQAFSGHGAMPAPAEILLQAFSEPHMVDGIDLTSYEPDRPTFTPRIGGCIANGAALAIVRRAEDGSAARNYFKAPLEPGRGKLMATYSGENVDPLPSFRGQPVEIKIGCRTARELAEAVYSALGPAGAGNDFRVGVAAVLYSRERGKMNTFIINRHDGDM
jgi:IMP cyclohydrolase